MALIIYFKRRSYYELRVKLKFPRKGTGSTLTSTPRVHGAMFDDQDHG